MTLIELLKRNRSYRRFDRSVRPSQEIMASWIEGLRYTASARNMQPLKYLLVTDDALCHTLSQSVVWAGIPSRMGWAMRKRTPDGLRGAAP